MPLRRPLERPAQAGGELGVVGLPDALAAADPLQVEGVAAEPELAPAGGTGQ